MPEKIKDGLRLVVGGLTIIYRGPLRLGGLLSRPVLGVIGRLLRWLFVA